ncbi:unnamed protein product, partial [Discosporangium mesarthrocarpum]
QVLESEIIPLRSDRVRIALQTGGEYHGNIHLDAVELIHGGPTPAERATASLTDALGAAPPAPRHVVLQVLSAEKLRPADPMGKSDPYVKKVFMDGEEVQRTKVIPMTLSPVWDETFDLPGPKGVNGGGETRGLRLEIWDHDAYGPGEHLGEVKIPPQDFVRAPPVRAVHELVAKGGAAPGRQPVSAPQRPPPFPTGKTTAPAKLGHLTIALQVHWPLDPEGSEEGAWVMDLLNRGAPIPSRGRALENLRCAAQREPKEMEEAARAKERLVRARAAAAAVWSLTEPGLCPGAIGLLTGLVGFGRGPRAAPAAFDLCRELQRHVLQLSPATAVIWCLRTDVGDPQVS